MEGGSGAQYIKFVKKYRKAHPELTWQQAMKKASKSYHKLKAGAIESEPELSKAMVKAKMTQAVKSEEPPLWIASAGAWPGCVMASAKPKKSKKLKAGGPLSNIPIIGPLLGIFGLGEPEADKLPKKLATHIAMLDDLLGSGLLAGSGYEAHAKKHSAAMKQLAHLAS